MILFGSGLIAFGWVFAILGRNQDSQLD